VYLWFAKTLADFEINDIAALPPLAAIRRGALAQSGLMRHLSLAKTLADRVR
jgi:hypothetical protein